MSVCLNDLVFHKPPLLLAYVWIGMRRVVTVFKKLIGTDFTPSSLSSQEELCLSEFTLFRVGTSGALNDELSRPVACSDTLLYHTITISAVLIIPTEEARQWHLPRWACPEQAD